MTDPTESTKPIVVLGGTGKTGRRVVERLTARGIPTRIGSPKADYAAGAAEHGAPAEFVGFLTYLFSDILGHNAYLTDGVQRALGREPRDLTELARDTAATGVWNVTPATGAIR
jgi:uncharacterized protein YbjT (DUF2867 family)